jgi:uncharacterized protein (DUF1501 family)
VSKGIDRRAALIGGVSALGGAALAAGCRRAGPAAARSDSGRVLVLVELMGGNDGLSMLVPKRDERYYAARPRTAIPPELTLDLDGEVGLHPALQWLRARYDRGEVAFVEGTGYPEPIYSHFRAFEVWHTARMEGRGSGDGWIGRLRDHLWAGDPRSELLVHVGGELPYSLACSAHPALGFRAPDSLQWFGPARGGLALERAAEIGDPHDGGSAILAEVRSRLKHAQSASARVVDACARYRPRAEYPATDFGGELRAVAALLRTDLGTRVFSLTLGNFDTHGGTQPALYQRLFTTLDLGLEAFLRDLEGSEAAERTLVVCFSEFGRRVEENFSGGTDHGAAGPMVLLGKPVRGGLYGARPSLAELDQDGNLVHTVDFRRVYASVLEGWFGADVAQVLGRSWSPLPLLRA